MKKTIYILILLTITFSFGCKKRFPDGPCISFRSVKERIHGTWKVNKYYINGADSTAEFNAKIGCEIEFTNNYLFNNDKRFCYFYFNNCNNGKTLSGFWYFFQGEKSIIFLKPNEDTTFITTPGPFGQVDQEGWHILRLTEKELNAKIFATPFWGVPMNTEYVLNLNKQ